MMNQKICSCRMWQLSGIPCPHAVSAIYHIHGNPDTFVDKVYFKDTCKATYENYLQPMRGRKSWPKSKMAPVLPPLNRRMPGRPKKARRKEFDEEQQRSATNKLLHDTSNAGNVGVDYTGEFEHIKPISQTLSPTTLTSQIAVRYEDANIIQVSSDDSKTIQQSKNDINKAEDQLDMKESDKCIISSSLMLYYRQM
ncbi:hypothetical protein POM88_009277 [Heracleum sosnowskyi]|uniref:SWIM-type domain-containing protein n=1 Tax=Heracleum sosnowskyi TaxID=360622 RepID=A0AAD8J8G6_9APIA|nr:hypothetical protein POM88_009277 [Heracleum sosnowskyi]